MPASGSGRSARRAGRARLSLVTSAGTVPAGPVIRAVGRRWTPVLAVPAASFTRHMVVVGSSGSGKTNPMIRLWAGWYAASLAAARRGRPRRC